mgnify:CR=1 FL=1
MGSEMCIRDSFLGGIAGISLLVAGLGILNTMLITVLERTREIGILKAIGAKNHDILLMFLIEALILGTMGGLAGLILGFAAAYLFGQLGFIYGFRVTPSLTTASRRVKYFSPTS